jgi:hypothetical protein
MNDFETLSYSSILLGLTPLEVPKTKHQVLLLERTLLQKATVLSLTSLLQIGSYYSFDIPSLIQIDLQHFLELENKDFQLIFPLLYSVLLFGSFLISFFIPALLKYDNRLLIILFTTIAFLGQFLFLIGMKLQVPSFLVIGRFTLGSTMDIISIVQVLILQSYLGKNSFLACFFIAKGMMVLNDLISRDLGPEKAVEYSILFSVISVLAAVILALTLENSTNQPDISVIDSATEQAPLLGNLSIESESSQTRFLIDTVPLVRKATLKPFFLWISLIGFLILNGSIYIYKLYIPSTFKSATPISYR